MKVQVFRPLCTRLLPRQRALSRPPLMRHLKHRLQNEAFVCLDLNHTPMNATAKITAYIATAINVSVVKFASSSPMAWKESSRVGSSSTNASVTWNISSKNPLQIVPPEKDLPWAPATAERGQQSTWVSGRTSFRILLTPLFGMQQETGMLILWLVFWLQASF